MSVGTGSMVKPRTGAVVGATTALVLLTAMNFVNYLDRYILPAVQEQIKHEFTLTDNQIGSLTLWFMVAYVCVSPITGWLGDRFPRKPMIVVAALGIAAMNFLTATCSWIRRAELQACGAGYWRGVLRNLCAGAAGGFLCGEQAQQGDDDLQYRAAGGCGGGV